MRNPSILRQILPLAFPAIAALALLSCTADAPDEAAEGAPSAAASVLPTFDAAMFDSIAWPTGRAAIDRGATVYAYSCAKCHGDSGAGDGDYRVQGRLLRVPSFLAADWRLAEDPVGLRRAIYSGSDRGSHHAGMGGLAPRDVDAVAEYITRLWADAG